MPGPVAIFDLDRTLHAGSGLGVLARHAFRSRFIGPDRMARSLFHDLVYRRRGSTDGHTTVIAELALDMAGGASLADLDPVLDEASAEIVASVRPPMKAVLELHQHAGHECVLLSASPQWLVTRIADAFGFDVGIGTLIEDDDGILTGRIIPPMCYGPGKLERMSEVFGWPGRREVTATYAYADSMSDLPLLEAVESPFVVAPDRRLRKVATERRWPILDA